MASHVNRNSLMLRLNVTVSVPSRVHKCTLLDEVALHITILIMRVHGQ